MMEKDLGNHEKYIDTIGLSEIKREVNINVIKAWKHKAKWEFEFKFHT